MNFQLISRLILQYYYIVGEHEIESDIGNFLHPRHLRIPNDVDAFIHDKQYEALNDKWYKTIPTDKSTYYDDRLSKAKGLTQNSFQTDKLKLSNKDLDPYYLLDAASIRIARLLDVSKGHLFLDMCSSPGGKSLVLLDNILRNNEYCNINNYEGTIPRLTCNEFDKTRLKLLNNIFKQFIPKDIIEKHILTTNFDAKLWGLAEQYKYDGILLDAPCSAERHLLKEKRLIDNWKSSQTNMASKKQFKLLRSAVNSLKVGGQIVYATCALSEMENDGLIEEYLKKKGSRVDVMDIDMNIGEKTKYGWKILPDIGNEYNEGPLYACKLIKKY